MSAESQTPEPSRHGLIGVVAWLWVGLPFLYGLIQLIAKIPALFSSS